MLEDEDVDLLSGSINLYDRLAELRVKLTDAIDQGAFHVQREAMLCKFWLQPLVLAKSDGFPGRELNQIRGLVQEYSARILEAWHEHCN